MSIGVPICWMRPSDMTDNGVGHRERLFLVVGDEHEGDAHGLLYLLQLLLHVLAQLQVERGERLVQQQDFRAG